ncbi:hypothetical protein [Escherichia phage AV111]|nr:hypothetical protein [Escherichia phage AV111]
MEGPKTIGKKGNTIVKVGFRSIALLNFLKPAIVGHSYNKDQDVLDLCLFQQPMQNRLEFYRQHKSYLT